MSRPLFFVFWVTRYILRAVNRCLHPAGRAPLILPAEGPALVTGDAAPRSSSFLYLVAVAHSFRPGVGPTLNSSYLWVDASHIALACCFFLPFSAASTGSCSVYSRTRLGCLIPPRACLFPAFSAGGVVTSFPSFAQPWLGLLMKHAGQGRPIPAVLEGEMLTPVSDTDAFHTQMSCTRNASVSPPPCSIFFAAMARDLKTYAGNAVNGRVHLSPERITFC